MSATVPPLKIPHSARRAAAGRSLVVPAYAVVAVALLWPLARDPGRLLVGGRGDALLNLWILAWDADRLRHGLDGFWQAPHFYPAADTLAWSEHLLGIAFFTAPVQWITGNPLLAYNLGLFGSAVLAGAGLYLLARDITGRRDAAFVAGLAFACLPYRVEHIGHLQVLFYGWMPVALWGLHRYFVARRRSGLAVFVAAYLLQALSNGYFLFALLVPAGITGAAGALRLIRAASTRRAAATVLGDALLAALVIGAVLAPVAQAYLRVRETHGFLRPRADLAHYSATPASYVSVSSELWLWGGTLPLAPPERALFPGAVLAGLAACGLLMITRRRWRRQSGLPSPTWDVATYAVVASAGVLLTLGPEPALGGGVRWTTGPYDWLAALVPGMDGLRVPARFAVVAYLGLAVLAAAGTAWLAAAARPRWRLVLLAGLSAAIVAEGCGAPLRPERFPFSDMAPERQAYEWLSEQPRGPMLELPVGQVAESVRYLYGTLTHGNRIVNGYSGYGWALEDFLGGPPSNELHDMGEFVHAVRALGLRYLVVHEHLFEDAAPGAAVSRAIEAQAAQLAGSRSFGTTRVFTVRPLNWVRPRPTGVPVAPAAVTASASHNMAALPRLLDGDVASRWTSDRVQRGGEWITLQLDRPRPLVFVRLDLERRSLPDYPRQMEISVVTSGGDAVVVHAGSVLPHLAASLAASDRPPGVGIPLPGVPASAVRLRQTGRTSRRLSWSIHEVRLWEAP